MLSQCILGESEFEKEIIDEIYSGSAAGGIHFGQPDYVFGLGREVGGENGRARCSRSPTGLA